MNRARWWLAVACGVAALVAGYLIVVRTIAPAAPQAAGSLDGSIEVDGSSTVYLITEAMARAFKVNHPEVSISAGVSGTGGGFKKFAAGDTDLSDASRPIKPAEIEDCRKNGIDFTELQVAWDGLTVVIHPENTWARKMTVAQLKRIWQPNSTVTKWSDVEPNWPDEPIKLYGPGADSGTFDFFTEKINGKEKASRKDYEASENDQVIVGGVASNPYALGYFGLAYYEENRDKLQAVTIQVDAASPAVLPSPETVLDRSYQPLSRPLLVYVKNASLKQAEVREFLRFYLRRADLVEQAGYIPLSTRGKFAQQDRLEDAIPE